MSDSIRSKIQELENEVILVQHQNAVQYRGSGNSAQTAPRMQDLTPS
ncbi:unnamed protein product [Ectocarpus sp. 12 AP-2014]